MLFDNKDKGAEHLIKLISSRSVVRYLLGHFLQLSNIMYARVDGK